MTPVTPIQNRRAVVRRLRFPLGLLVLTQALLPRSTFAQTDVERPLPNVLLLVDSSGSMEYKAEANTNGDFEYPICNPGEPNLPNENSRWIDLLSVMTGTFVNYSCFAQARNTSLFRDEFGLPGAYNPYDFGYDTPYHRAISNGCIIGPGVSPGASSPYDFPARAVNTFTFSQPSTVLRPTDLTAHAGCPNWSQRPDGVLDIYKGRLRFGLMTFDSHPDEGRGLTGEDPPAVNNQSGVEGIWSYYGGNRDQTNGPSASTGYPPDCSSPMMQEVGARNAAAPPWEGRMVAFGDENADPADAERRADWIQQILLSTRPYGATPLAGQLHDAKYFLWQDDTTDPISGVGKFGPKDDDLWQRDGCRRTVIIVLSDGEPNLDLRPDCDLPGVGVPPLIAPIHGYCPFKKPAEIAHSLAHDNDNLSVETFVIGFAMTHVLPVRSPALTQPIPCAELIMEGTNSDCDNPANADNRSLQACCELNRIAMNGTSGTELRKAEFPQNRQELRDVFNRILANMGSATTRSAPAFSTVSGAGVPGMQFSASFMPTLGGIWQGSLLRRRTICNDALATTELEPDINSGDDFAANLESSAGAPRKLYTVLGQVPGTEGLSLRPNAGQVSGFSDGLQDLQAEQTDGLSPDDLAAEMTPTVMNVAATDCTEVNSDTACAQAIMRWGVGLLNADNEQRVSRLGGIYNSSPKIVAGPPQEFLPDESYRRFTQEMATQARSTMLYVSTVDGFLHAFKVAPFSADGDRVDSQENNELWSFIPPAVLPAFKAQYPNTPAILLDGEPVIADVPSMIVQAGGDEVILLQRTETVAQNGEGSFRTILVQGFGVGQVEGGYFALDVTTPDLDDGGPRFLWQLTRDNQGRRLFGNGGTPLITTLALNVGQTVVNTPVAVLPGGNSGSAVATVGPNEPMMDVLGSSFDQRPQVNSYTDAVEARSLTIVRLDTGEIVRTFRAPGSNITVATNKITPVNITSPIVGQPAAYPQEMNTVADRIFVGDRDGRLWRVDVASSDPGEWDMKIFFDAFSGMPINAGQPIETQPVVSIDTDGNVVVAASTGSQRVGPLPPERPLNRVVSLTDMFDVDANEFETKVNWIYTLGCPTSGCGQTDPPTYAAERVTGRMNLFAGALYFATGIPGTDSPAVCSQQQYRLFGMDYLEPLNANREEGGLGKLPSVSDPNFLVVARDAADGVVFGSTLERSPSCFTTQTVSSDAYFGSGNRTRINSINPGSFSLTFQIGGQANQQQVEIQRTALAPPRKFSRISSWATIFE